MLKHITMYPRVGIKDSSDKNTKYICIDSPHMLMPRETWELIKGSCIKLNYDYKQGRVWYIERDQSVSTSSFTEDELTALRVARRMEDANGNG